MRLRPAAQVDAEAAAMALTREKREAISGAMQGFKLEYVPAWAANLPEERWRQSTALARAHAEQARTAGANV